MQVSSTKRMPAFTKKLMLATTAVMLGYFYAAGINGTPDPTSTGQVQRVAYVGNDQCAPLNLK